MAHCLVEAGSEHRFRRGRAARPRRDAAAPRRSPRPRRATPTGVDLAAPRRRASPTRDALEQLLAEVTRDPSIGIAGPKVRGWYDRRLLLEVGVTIARSGRRETWLERREQDQGQHDGTRTSWPSTPPGC